MYSSRCGFRYDDFFFSSRNWLIDSLVYHANAGILVTSESRVGMICWLQRNVARSLVNGLLFCCQCSWYKVWEWVGSRQTRILIRRSNWVWCRLLLADRVFIWRLRCISEMFLYSGYFAAILQRKDIWFATLWRFLFYYFFNFVYFAQLSLHVFPLVFSFVNSDHWFLCMKHLIFP